MLNASIIASFIVTTMFVTQTKIPQTKLQLYEYVSERCFESNKLQEIQTGIYTDKRYLTHFCR